jgi:hypothetical protein
MKRTHANISTETASVKNRLRGRTDLLRSRLHILSGTDKVLITMYVVNGNSCRQIARIRGVSETTISRRIRAIAERLMDGQYVRCLRSRQRLTADQMAIAKEFFLLGLPMSQIAEKRRSSIHRVRKALLEIRDLVRAAEPPSKPP